MGKIYIFYTKYVIMISPKIKYMKTVLSREKDREAGGGAWVTFSIALQEYDSFNYVCN